MGKGASFSYLATLDDVIASRGRNLLIVDGKGRRRHRRFGLAGQCDLARRPGRAEVRRGVMRAPE
ncbi:hypothetical protein CK489_21730 [Bradyrhizobium sp. UFLA03-84]|nr:hypothetical protein CK489_21730 [Bradyrhizobium sp. UFLA03-84]